MPPPGPPCDGRFFLSRERVRFQVPRIDGGRGTLKPQPKRLIPILRQQPYCSAATPPLIACRTSQKAQFLGVSLIRPCDILSRFAATGRNLQEGDAQGRSSSVRARFLGKVTTMANAASAPPGK